MATRPMNFFEKMAVRVGVLYRHQANQFPRRSALLKQVWAKELRPPTAAEVPAIKADFAKIVTAIQSRAYTKFTVREFLVYTGVALEILAWFFVGEMIGRRHVFGYLVPASYISSETKKKAAALNH